jgi:hypothetical protein
MISIPVAIRFSHGLVGSLSDASNSSGSDLRPHQAAGDRGLPDAGEYRPVPDRVRRRCLVDLLERNRRVEAGGLVPDPSRDHFPSIRESGRPLAHAGHARPVRDQLRQQYRPIDILERCGGWNPGGWFYLNQLNQGVSLYAPAAVSRTPESIDLFLVAFSGEVRSTFLSAAGGWNAGGWFPIHPEIRFYSEIS